MAQIAVHQDALRQIPSREGSAAARLRSLASQTLALRSSLRLEISGREEISAGLKRAAGQLEQEARVLQNLRSGLEQIAGNYQRTEQNSLQSLAAVPNPRIL